MHQSQHVAPAVRDVTETIITAVQWTDEHRLAQPSQLTD